MYSAGPFRPTASRFLVPTTAALLSEADREGRHIRDGHGVLLHAGAATPVQGREGRENDDNEGPPAAHRPLLAQWLPGGETWTKSEWHTAHRLNFSPSLSLLYTKPHIHHLSRFGHGIHA